MRSDLELLKLVLKEYEACDDTAGTRSGLCLFIECLSYQNLVLNEEECQRLHDIIRSNTPSEAYVSPIGTRTGWFFEPGKKEPRIKFLNQLIDKYESKG